MSRVHPTVARRVADEHKGMLANGSNMETRPGSCLVGHKECDDTRMQISADVTKAHDYMLTTLLASPDERASVQSTAARCTSHGYPQSLRPHRGRWRGGPDLSQQSRPRGKLEVKLAASAQRNVKLQPITQLLARRIALGGSMA